MARLGAAMTREDVADGGAECDLRPSQNYGVLMAEKDGRNAGTKELD